MGGNKRKNSLSNGSKKKRRQEKLEKESNKVVRVCPKELLDLLLDNDPPPLLPSVARRFVDKQHPIGVGRWWDCGNHRQFFLGSIVDYDDEMHWWKVSYHKCVTAQDRFLSKEDCDVDELKQGLMEYIRHVRETTQGATAAQDPPPPQANNNEQDVSTLQRVMSAMTPKWLQEMFASGKK